MLFYHQQVLEKGKIKRKVFLLKQQQKYFMIKGCVVNMITQTMLQNNVYFSMKDKKENKK